MRLKPRCLEGGRDPAFNIRGYFLPCCWVDNDSVYDFFEMMGFFDDHFFIDNLNTKEDILNVFKSEEWLNFYNMLLENPNQVPQLCHHHCSINNYSKGVTSKIREGREIGTTDKRLLDLIDVTDSKE